MAMAVELPQPTQLAQQLGAKAGKGAEVTVTVLEPHLMRDGRMPEVRYVGVPAEAARGSAALKTLADGVALTGRELLQVFEKHGIRRIEPLGERFDPHLHEALFEAADASLPSGTVSTVVSPGYVIGSRPLRAAKVGVARGGPDGKKGD